MNKQLHLDISLRDDATFFNYVGSAPELLLKDSDWLFLWGNPGTGKSHLLQAICHQTENSIYLESLGQYQPDILGGLEAIDVVCIDDIQSVLGNAEWEESLFHLLNAIRDSHKKLIISADKPAKQLEVKLADLQSRLISASAIETDNLDDTQKLEVLMNRAHGRGYRLAPEVGLFILKRSSRDLRKLMDILDLIERETLRQGKTVSIPFVKQTLKL